MPHDGGLLMFCCPVDPSHDIFIVFPGDEADDPDRLGVQVEADGTVTNVRGDGVIGVPDVLRELAEDETTAVCAFCTNARVGAAIEWSAA